MTEDTKPKFDPTINLGHLLSMGGILFLSIGAYFSFGGRLGAVESQLARITSVLEISIRQEEQIKSLTYRLEKLENARAR